MRRWYLVFAGLVVAAVTVVAQQTPRPAAIGGIFPSPDRRAGEGAGPFKTLVMDAFKRAGAAPQFEQKPEETCSIGAVGAHGPMRGGTLVMVLGSVLLTLQRRRRNLSEIFPWP